MFGKIKSSFACAGVSTYGLNKALVANYTPKAGDVGVFRVIDPCDSYVADAKGINRHIFEGDHVMLAFGSRYATNQIEGYVPDAPMPFYHLLARGGVAGVLKTVNATMRAEPAVLELVAYATDAAGMVYNTINRTDIDAFHSSMIQSKVVLSIGSSMDSGKTTTAAYLCGGLAKAGHTTAYIKLTGTAFPKDTRSVEDRGAHYAIDFTHFGYPSTYLTAHNELIDLYGALVQVVQQQVQPEYVVIEIADGILQRETAALLQDPRFMQTVHGVIYSSGDSLGAISSLQLLADWNVHPFALAGLFTASPLLVEEVTPLVQVPILTLPDLLTPRAAQLLSNIGSYIRMDERKLERA